MQQILHQLSILVVLTGISVAIVQYLFTNHQAHLKDFIASLKRLDFDKKNEYDLELESRWESEVSNCKRHTYLIKPNNSILFGFGIITLLVFAYIISLGVFGFKVDVVFIEVGLFIISVVLFLWLIMNFVILKQIFKKESKIKSEFDKITKQHQLSYKTLNKNA